MAIDIKAWYEKYGPMVFRRCKGILHSEEDALDALHDVFVQLMRAKLDGRYPSSLLYTMATNTCLNKLRWKKRHGEYSIDADEYFEIQGKYDGFEKAEARMLIEDIFQTESEAVRAVCYMYYADNMTLKEIGEAVGCSISGVRKRLLAFKTRALKKIEGDPQRSFKEDKYE
jgi:RNA polymerase sigma-70 factor (ECF subfamily)